MQIIENRWGNWLKDILSTFMSSQQPECIVINVLKHLLIINEYN